MRSRLWLFLWILGILFPMAFLGSLWPAFGHVFNAVFSPGWMHVAMHAFLYAVLVFLLSQWIKPTAIKSIVILFGLVLFVGCLHESFQILAITRWTGFVQGIVETWPAEVFDLIVDLCGAVLGLALARAIAIILLQRDYGPRF